MRIRSASSDLLFFLRSWFENPLSVAAIAPSGEPLGRLMTRDISRRDGPVLELGAGTGVFTKALLRRGLAQRDLILVDSSERFAALLAGRFPDARIVVGDAANLLPLGVALPRSVGAVVSGLPLLSMPNDKVGAIVGGAFHYLKDGGALYQFTYGLRCPIPRATLQALGLKAVCVGRVFRNLPPAAVYRISRK
ncbi:class I SAM-dependent methyltransferase [Burkholderia glumae]|uniref:Methyltransferase domain-containing protein n=1 Tax=Burkholderia glumae TaxID=337 RepID=A0AAQ0BV56_BURGL|nr:methyltransferase domain-containing protein [Burkholderia glumae]ACR29339.1 Putative phospholipid N-methyltransferase [Burkholderia glumae BGR1]AJY65095.1 methyltransferase domain protein [Burkholderia glumae LMG 2196 = ATCC 33617]KHJ60316.1 SAM-dependent methlyltransferase [Burkholderia glumae]MCM2537834.1 methyltransferase domain-containing protein [Burkholderia glumae]MCR1768987.1 methyltransferase domain-containing protein [Burkholderia glumae]